MPRSQVSGDGAHYAWSDTSDPNYQNAIVHVVDVVSGNDRVISTKGNYNVVSYEPDGLYAGPIPPPRDGLAPEIQWLVDPNTGSAKQLPGKGFGYAVSNGTGWAIAYDPKDPTPVQYMSINSLLRIDGTSGARIEWFYKQGTTAVSVMGFDGKGDPVLIAIDAAGNDLVLILTGKDQYTTLYAGPDLRPTYLPDAAVVDVAHGVWFSSNGGIYLYTNDGRFIRVSNTAGTVAGGCA